MKLKLIVTLCVLVLTLGACSSESTPESPVEPITETSEEGQIEETEEPITETEEPTEEAEETNTEDPVASEDSLETFGNDKIGYFDLPAGTTEESQGEDAFGYYLDDYPFNYYITVLQDADYITLEQSRDVQLETREGMGDEIISSSFFSVGEEAQGFYIQSISNEDQRYSYEIRFPEEGKTLIIERSVLGIQFGQEEMEEKEGDFLLESYRLTADGEAQITFMEGLPVVLGTVDDGLLTLPENFIFESDTYVAVSKDDDASYVQPQLMTIEGTLDDYLAQYQAFAEENNVTLSHHEKRTIKDTEMLILEGNFSTGETYRYFAYPSGDYYMTWHIISPDAAFVDEISTYLEENIELNQ